MGKKNSRKSVDAAAQIGKASQLWTAGGSLAVAATALGLATPAAADFNYTLTGFVRTETTVNAYGQENENNQGGNLFNKQSISRDAYVPPSLQNVVLPGLGVPIPPPGVLKWDSVKFAPFVNDVARRGDDVKSTDNVMNYDIVRVEAELTSELTKDISFTGRIRGVYDPGFYDNFNAHDVSNINGGIVSGVPQLYRGRTNLFQHIVDGGKHPSPLELSGTNYSVDLPTFILAYSHGALSVRAGNQSVAWGQALFFRVMDVPQGLDLRRHLFVDRALEEYADERISSLGIRAGYQVSDEILVDSFINKFQPTILPNTGSPYNVVPAQFTVHDRYEQGGYADKFSYGIRAKAEYGTWGWQAMATRRWNPDGVFRWTQSGVVRPFAGAGFGQVVNNLYNVTPDPTCGRDGVNNAGTAISHTGLSVEPAGVYSGDEFYKYAADARLNATDALNHLITDLSSCGTALGASTVDSGSLSQGHAEVDTFTVAAGNSLRGHIERKYFQENVFGLGALYVTSSEKYPFLDQLIFNLEGTFTPNRTFTDTGLSSSFAKRDEASVALIADKWHRFFDGFPGTLIIMQVLWKPTSDLAGRLLSGYGGTQTSLPRGIHNATYLVLGGQQPWPNRIFELEFAALADTHGGIFEQIGLRWNPGHQWHIEGFYNGTQAKLFGANPNSNFMGTLSFIDEFTLRIGHEF